MYKGSKNPGRDPEDPTGGEVGASASHTRQARVPLGQRLSKHVAHMVGKEWWTLPVARTSWMATHGVVWLEWVGVGGFSRCVVVQSPLRPHLGPWVLPFDSGLGTLPTDSTRWVPPASVPQGASGGHRIRNENGAVQSFLAWRFS